VGHLSHNPSPWTVQWHSGSVYARAALCLIMVPGAVGSRTCGILRVRLLLQRRKTWSSNRCTWDNYPCLRLPFACFSRSLQSSAGRASSRDGVCNAHWRRLCHRQLLGASFLAATHVDFGHWRCLAKQRAGDDGDEDVSYDIEDFGDIDDDDEFNFDEFDPTMTFENSGRAISVRRSHSWVLPRQPAPVEAVGSR